MKFQLTSSRRGWQNQMFFHCWVFSISTHILTKRMTGVWNTSSIKCSYFNSHPHEEDDANSADIASLKTFQLTSSRRGWHARSVLSYYGWIFQLTSSRRGWLVFTLVVGYYSLFQLTSSRRGWLLRFEWLSDCFHFNSHPHEEDDYAIFFIGWHR